jgi:2-oxoglutarate ferredoxin oxidoreductase subunit gamma
VTDRDRVEIRFAGQGGQGVVVASAILGEAATRAGLSAAGSTVYGSQARGGAARADLVLARCGFIDFPHVTHPHYLAVMSDEVYRAYLPGLATDGVVLFDSYYVERDPGGAVHHEVEATRMALDALGRSVAANIVMLGALIGLTGIVKTEHASEALRASFAHPFHEANEKALSIGVERGRAIAAQGGGA